MVIGLGELQVGALVHLERGRDVEHGERLHAARVVARQAVRHASAAVVAHGVELDEAERLHGLHHVERHGALRVVGVPGHAARLGRVAVAAQVRTHHGVVARERRRDLVPHRVRLGVAVQQQHRRSIAAGHEVDRGAADLDLLLRETGEQAHSNRSAAATLRSSATRML